MESLIHNVFDFLPSALHSHIYTFIIYKKCCRLGRSTRLPDCTVFTLLYIGGGTARTNVGLCIMYDVLCLGLFDNVGGQLFGL